MTKPKAPKQLSQGEEAFAQHCRAEGLAPLREYRFCEGRKWRLDFYFQEAKLAIEIEGMGRHQRFLGFEEDCRKYANAALLGITVLRVTTRMVMSGEAIEMTLALLRAGNT